MLSMRPKIKSNINPYIQKPKKEKNNKKHLESKNLRQKLKRKSKLEEISNNPKLIGLPEVNLTQFNYDPKQNQIPKYDLLFEAKNDLYVFALRENLSSKPQRNIKESLTQEIKKLNEKYPNKTVHAIFGNKKKIVQKTIGAAWSTNLLEEK